MEIRPSLKAVLKRLRLSGILPTLPERVIYARKMSVEPQDFLELVLQDEVEHEEDLEALQEDIGLCFGDLWCFVCTK